MHTLFILFCVALLLIHFHASCAVVHERADEMGGRGDERSKWECIHIFINRAVLGHSQTHTTEKNINVQQRIDPICFLRAFIWTTLDKNNHTLFGSSLPSPPPPFLSASLRRFKWTKAKRLRRIGARTRISAALLCFVCVNFVFRLFTFCYFASWRIFNVGAGLLQVNIAHSNPSSWRKRPISCHC